MGCGRGAAAHQCERRAARPEPFGARKRAVIKEGCLRNGATTLHRLERGAVVKPQVMSKLVHESRVERVGVQVEHKARLADEGDAGPSEVVAARDDDRVEVEARERVGAEQMARLDKGARVERIWVGVGRAVSERIALYRAAKIGLCRAVEWHRLQHRRLKRELAPRELVKPRVGVREHVGQVSNHVAGILVGHPVGTEGGGAPRGVQVARADRHDNDGLGAARVGGRRAPLPVAAGAARPHRVVRLEHKDPVERESPRPKGLGRGEECPPAER
eukprot:scaffold156_cov25-Tisochrysis_lutea.AAC.5